VTSGTAACDVLEAAAFDQTDPWFANAAAFGRAIGTALVLASLRWCYAKFTGREGLGVGDVKLARLRGETIDASMKIPFGAFQCPAL
jgi:leader peptidase (prepilin peptidase)/N-methyltransferase